MVAYGALLPQRVLDIPQHGWVNLHFSLLPAWRGAAPVQHAIWPATGSPGRPRSGSCSSWTPGRSMRRSPNRSARTDTSGDLLERLGGQRGPTCWSQTLDGIEDGAAGRPAAAGEPDVSYAAKITVEDAEIDWTAPADEIDRLIRGTFPGAGRVDHLPRRAVQDQLGPARPPTTWRRAPWRSPSDASTSEPAPERCELGEVQARASSRWPPPTGRAGSAFGPRARLGG